MAGVSYTRRDRIASIHIDGPNGNALTPALRRELNDALRRYRDDDDAWMAVISSEGRDFCLGSADSAPGTRREARERSLLWGGGFMEIWKPTIAAVQGQCRGEGLAVALSCDLRVGEAATVLQADFGAQPDEPNCAVGWKAPLLLSAAGVKPENRIRRTNSD